MADKTTKKTVERWRSLIEHSWKGLDKHDLLEYTNPFHLMTETDRENPDLYLLNLMRKPENFSFTCKFLFNIEIMPFQGVILQEMWYRPFPILLAARGASKCIKGDSYVQTNSSFERIQNIIGDSPEGERKYLNIKMFGENGYQPVEYGWNNGFGKTKRITTRMGFELEGTPNHPIRVVRNGQIEWVNLENIQVGDYVPINRNEEWLENPTYLDLDIAYTLGSLIGDGGYTLPTTLSFTTADEESFERVNIGAEKMWGRTFKKIPSSKYSKYIYGRQPRTELFTKYGFNSSVCGEKDFPKIILSAQKDAMRAFLSGLFDTDGTIPSNRKVIGFCSKSKNLATSVQYFLLKFGIVSRVKPRLNKKYNRYYYNLYISGKSANIFAKEIGFKLKRKQDQLLQHIKKDTFYNTNIDIYPKELISDEFIKEFENRQNPSYEAIKKAGYTNSLVEKNYFYDRIINITDSYCQTYDVHIPDDHSFISNGFISHNSFTSALYILLRAIFLQGRKIVIIAPGFRQAKNVMNYIEGLWNNSPILQDLFSGAAVQSGPRHDTDRWTLRVGYSTITALPLGIDGDRIRGERSNDTFIEEIQSFGGTEVLERVVGGFSIVSSNPVEKVKQAARIAAMKDLGMLDEKQAEDISFNSVKNQQIMCGTAYYEWNHFAQYHAKWKRIIESRGDNNKIKDIFTNQDGVLDIPEGFDWRDYSIIRIPVTALPKNYMDSAQVARAKATMHAGLYEMEYGTLFVRDSNGFYRATLIDGATANDRNIVQWNKVFGENMEFTASLQGKPDFKYVFGLDPASERDNFAIVVLELHKTHRRVVHCWTFNKKMHRDLMTKGLIQETDYYGYIARKVRDLLKVFPSDYIGIDAQGGGIGAMEAFHSKANLLEGEEAFWPAIIEDDEQPTDNYPGRHIIYPVQFANSKWTSEANHGMRKDLEDKRLIFPMFDSVALMEASAYLKKPETEVLYTSLEDVMLEVEEMKSELISIIHTTTKNGTERWDTPEVKVSGQKKESQKKDRYSALLIANTLARQIDKLKARPMIIDSQGGFVGSRTFGTSPQLYNAPEWFSEQVKDVSDSYGFA